MARRCLASSHASHYFSFLSNKTSVFLLAKTSIWFCNQCWKKAMTLQCIGKWEENCKCLSCNKTGVVWDNSFFGRSEKLKPTCPFQIPKEEKVQEFFSAVDDFFEDDGNDDKLLGVHSTFGGNRLWNIGRWRWCSLRKIKRTIEIAFPNIRFYGNVDNEPLFANIFYGRHSLLQCLWCICQTSQSWQSIVWVKHCQRHNGP